MKKATKRRIIATLITATICGYTWWTRKPVLVWLFTRIPPETPPDCKPRYRTWKNGIEQ